MLHGHFPVHLVLLQSILNQTRVRNMTDWIRVEEQAPPIEKPYLVRIETVGFHYGSDPIKDWTFPINTNPYSDTHQFFIVTHWKPIE